MGDNRAAEGKKLLDRYKTFASAKRRDLESARSIHGSATRRAGGDTVATAANLARAERAQRFASEALREAEAAFEADKDARRWEREVASACAKEASAATEQRREIWERHREKAADQMRKAAEAAAGHHANAAALRIRANDGRTD